MSSLDQPVILYQGPPRWTGTGWENGDRFTLSGSGKCDLGVELAGAVSGLERPDVEHRYDAGANTPGSVLVSAVAGRRNLLATINILGTSAKDLRYNKRRWERNHQEEPGNPGRLWFLTNDGGPRYMKAYKSESAGTSTLNKDPHLRYLYEGFDWGWTSDHPYFFGYTETRVMDRAGGVGEYRDTFFNDSTAPHVFPKVTLYGPGRFQIDGGYSVGPLSLPDLQAGESIRVDYNPKNRTVLRRTTAGTVLNIWPSLGGQRPIMSFEPESQVTMSVLNLNTAVTPARNPEVEYTPEFVSWV